MPTTRDRIVAAAVELTTTSGWASVTMSRLAAAAGVSRQTVYNEVGSKPALAETMISRSWPASSRSSSRPSTPSPTS